MYSVAISHAILVVAQKYSGDSTQLICSLLFGEYGPDDLRVLWVLDVAIGHDGADVFHGECYLLLRGHGPPSKVSVRVRPLRK